MFRVSRTGRPLALLVLSGSPSEARGAPALAHMFSSEAVDVSVATNWDEARRQLGSGRFDAVVVDRQACDPACLREVCSLGQDGMAAPILMLPSIAGLAGAGAEPGRHAGVEPGGARPARKGRADGRRRCPRGANDSEGARAASGQFDETILNALPVAIAVVSQSDSLQYANPPAEELISFAGDALDGTTLRGAPGSNGDATFAIAAPRGETRTIRAQRVPIEWAGEPCTLVILRDHSELAVSRAALAESDRRLHDTFEAAMHGIGFVSFDDRWLQVNEAMCRLLGVTSGEMLGTDCQAILHPDDRRLGRRRNRLLRAGKISGYQFEQRFVHKDGTPVPVQVSVSVVRDDAGEPLHFVKHVVDLSGQRRAESLLKSLMYAIEENPIGTFIASVSGQIDYANRAFSAITGHAAKSAEVAAVLRCDDVFPGSIDEVWAKVLGGSLWQGELRARRQDGTAYWLDLTLVPVPDSLDSVRMIAGFMADVTEWKEADESLRESNARLRGILDNVGSGIVVTDDEGRIEKINPAAWAMFGYAPNELIGRNIEVLIDRSNLSDHGRGKRSSEPARGIDIARLGKDEITCRRKSGDTFFAALSANEVSLAHRKIRVAVITDLTERKDAEDQLQQAVKLEAVGRLTGGISHDFNNILGVVLGNLQLLDRQGGHDPVLRDLVNAATEATQRGAELTKRLLAFSRSQTLAPRVVDINRLIGSVERVLRRTLRESVEISTSLEARSAAVMVDTSQLESALLNLAINAEDAMSGSGKLSIRTINLDLDAACREYLPDTAEGFYVCITISDDGQGIPRELLDRVFEPFFTTKPFGKGSGLGLSMVYGFIRQSGGHIVVESEEGEGARFSIFLPCRSDPVEAAPEGAAGDAADMPGGTETILLVEDDRGFRRVATHLLEEFGYVVVPARDAPTALRVLKSLTSIDLLLTDMVMPGGMDGLELARRVHEERPGLPVLLSSGHPRDAFADQCEFRFIGKPYTGAALAKAVREALDHRTVEEI